MLRVPFNASPAHDEFCLSANSLMAQFNDWTLRWDVRTIFLLVYLIVFTCGLLGNGLLIETIGRRKAQRSVPNLFLLNLAISDVLLCVTALPITPAMSFMKVWLFGGFLCRFIPLCQAVSVFISSYSLCFIAVDRYRHIVTPLAKRQWDLKDASVIVAISWALSILIGMPLFLVHRLDKVTINETLICGKFCSEMVWPSGRTKLMYGVAVLIIQFMIPLTIMAACYWKILQTVRKDYITKRDQLLVALSTEQQQKTVARKRRVMYTLMTMVVAFVLSWFPITVSNILRDFGISPAFLDSQKYFTHLFVHLIAMTSVVWNPGLYFWVGKRNRRALKHDMFRLTKARGHRDNMMRPSMLFDNQGLTAVDGMGLFPFNRHRLSTIPNHSALVEQLSIRACNALKKASSAGAMPPNSRKQGICTMEVNTVAVTYLKENGTECNGSIAVV